MEKTINYLVGNAPMNKPHKPLDVRSHAARNLLFALLVLLVAMLACNLPSINQGESPPNELTAMAYQKTEIAGYAAIDTAVAQTQVVMQQEEQLRLTVTAFAAQQSQPLTNQQPPVQNPPGNIVSCQWIVTGSWNTTSSNNYHPVFDIQQTGTALSGTATLPADEAVNADYNGTVGTGTGSVVGNVFTYTVTWPPRKSTGQVISGTYTGTITEGRIEGQAGSATWSGTGPSTCVTPSTQPETQTIAWGDGTVSWSVNIKNGIVVDGTAQGPWSWIATGGTFDGSNLYVEWLSPDHSSECGGHVKSWQRVEPTQVINITSINDCGGTKWDNTPFPRTK
jgi:hypothetical protein